MNSLRRLGGSIRGYRGIRGRGIITGGVVRLRIEVGDTLCAKHRVYFFLSQSGCADWNERSFNTNMLAVQVIGGALFVRELKVIK